MIKRTGDMYTMDELVCAVSILKGVPEKALQLQPVIQELKDCCRGLDWSTTDPLGIGGLLLNVARLIDLDIKNDDLPECIRPKKLLTDSLNGLEGYSQMYNPHLNARQRLAFRECGLSLGLRVVMGLKGKPIASDPSLNKLHQFIFLADE